MNSYLNIVFFILVTITYYLFFRPSMTLETISSSEKYKKFSSNKFLFLGIYLLLVLVSQYLINTYIITSNCGGKITENLGSAGIITFIPWILIFGLVVVILIIYPGFKSAFSDVIGYFYVSSAANKVLADLLVDEQIQKKMDSDPTISQQQKETMQEVAETIIKIFGNKSILINQIVPMNFLKYWDVLTPLMKTQYQTPGPATTEIQTKLFKLVETRDIIGEAFWYIYAGFLVTSFIQLKMSQRGCVSSLATMEKNYQTYLQQQQETTQQEQQSTSQVYTTTG